MKKPPNLIPDEQFISRMRKFITNLKALHGMLKGSDFRASRKKVRKAWEDYFSQVRKAGVLLKKASRAGLALDDMEAKRLLNMADILDQYAQDGANPSFVETVVPDLSPIREVIRQLKVSVTGLKKRKLASLIVERMRQNKLSSLSESEMDRLESLVEHALAELSRKPKDRRSRPM